MKPSNKTSKPLRVENIRRIVQVLSFLAFLFLFAVTIGRYSDVAKGTVLNSKAPIDTFFRIDPLIGLTTMIAIRHTITVLFIYGLPVVILTILLGRVFCGWICPLGTTLDATDTLFYHKRRAVSGTSSRNTTDAASLRNIKYYILGAVLLAAIFASQIAYLFDPITIITRTFTFVAYPIVHLLARTNGVQNSYLPNDVQYSFRFNFVAAGIFIGILALNSISRRYWCRNLCPLGALLGLLSRVSVLRRVVGSNCISCSKCAKSCKMSAVLDDPKNYRAAECIYCYSCTPICPTSCTHIVPKIKSEGRETELDLNRRRLFQAFGIGVMAAALGKTNFASKTARRGNIKVSSSFLLRPPGALPEDEFVDRCVRCSECMKVCPTNGLQPALTEAGIEGLWTPVLVAQVGECTQNCNLCSQVCSTQAIQPFEITEKSHIYLGTAVIDRSQCIVWNSDKQCLVCDEHCSYHALHWKTVDGVRRPFVDEHKCVGCGICENACPIQPSAAVRVYSFGDKRHWTRDQQKEYFKQSTVGKEQSSAGEG